MKLAVILEQPFWFDGKTYSTTAPFINFVLSFKKYFDEIRLFVPLSMNSMEGGPFSFEIDEKIKFVQLPFCRTSIEMARAAPWTIPQWIKIFRRELSSWDLAWIVGSYFPTFLFFPLARRGGKKVFFYIRSNFFKEVASYRNRGILNYSLGMLGGWVADRIIFNAIRKNNPVFVIGNELYNIYGGKGTKVFKVYPTLITNNDIVSHKKFSNKEFKVIFVGRMTPEKGLEVLVEAMERLIKIEGCQVICKVVGTGKDEGRMKALVAAKGLDRFFEFAGFVPPGKKLFEQYDWADVKVLSSHTEGIPKTLYEAMARGLPIVSTDVGGIAEIVRDGENGLLVPPGNSPALAAAIKKIADDPELREYFSRANLNKAKEFTIEKQRDFMFSIIKKEIIEAN
jgi:glycosyltransferase involved in cell wall biosynthesis